MNTESDAQELAAFGQAVRELREQRGMSVDDLSLASRLPRDRKMSSRRINRIEAGEVDPHYDEMIALADALNVTPGTLVIYAEQLWTDDTQ
jgi:transcriptional regulator with XRE-family HTH domain